MAPSSRNEPVSDLSFARAAIGLAALMLPCVVVAAPGDVLFSDDFERAALAPWTTTNPGVSGIVTGAQVSGSPTNGAFTRSQAVTITGPGFNAAVPAVELGVWVRRGSDAFSEDPDGGEDLAIEYRRADNTWGLALYYTGAGLDGQIFTDTVALPSDALHGNLAIRARQTGGSGGNFDHWHIDDVVVTERAAAPTLTVGVCDDFEAGIAGNWSINSTSGFAGVSDATSQSPLESMYLNGGVVEVTSLVVDTSGPAFSALTMWIRRGADFFSEDPDGGEDLVVEYLDDVGGWVVLETFPGIGAPGEIFLRTFNLPAAGRHANMRLRFRMTGGSGPQWDFWHIDDVCFDGQLVPDLLVSKVAVTLSDPINGTSAPKAIPGAVVRYALGVTNQGPGAVDSDSLVVTEVVPMNTALYVSTAGGDPLAFVDGPVASGLSYDFANDVAFSNQIGGGPPYTSAPVPDADGFDPAVTGFRVNPGGALSGASPPDTPSFNILFNVRVQ